MLTKIDFAVIGFYLLFLLVIGWSFRRSDGDSDAYFRGGGRMSWWLVGMSIFMGSFSAWTFTGAGGLAYEHGLVALTIFLANALILLINGIAFAPWIRQTRVIASIEYVRARLGGLNAQIYFWRGVPIYIVVAGIWLYGMAIFCAPVFGISVRLTIFLCGLVAMFVATMGGTWAVIAGNFIQGLILVPVTIVAGVGAFLAAGGLPGLREALPATHWDITAAAAAGYGGWWLLALMLDKVMQQCGLNAPGRYLSVSTSPDARKASFLGAALFAAGALIWFLPPLAARAMNIDVAAMFPGLNKPVEGAFVAAAVRCLPAGLFGLLVTAIFASTMSSMDGALNGSAGTFVRGFYLPILRPKASERELVLAGRVTTVLLGFIVIGIALIYTTWTDMGVFKLMMIMGALLGIPGAVPMFWCVFVRRAPDWAAWVTLPVGLVYGLLVSVIPQSAWGQALVTGTSLESLVAWLHVHYYPVLVIGDTIICSAIYLGACAWARHRPPLPRAAEIDAFFKTMKKPVLEDAAPIDLGSQRVIARLAIAYGLFIATLMLLPNSWSARLSIAFCAGFMLVIGLWIRSKSRRPRPAPADSKKAAAARVAEQA
jgi:Na+/proline symporter